ncbi:hypothetical protein [Acidocella sp.]|jgi:hypothetical protein|uniref:hypothetical protein n=1 Tax=Acidocella sp. TaxID=50710 RepID=UPI002F42DC68
MITALGAVFLPLCLFYWRTPERLLQLVFIGGAFSAAAVLVIGNYGIAPGLLPALLFIGYFLLRLILGASYPTGNGVLQVLTPFILVVIGALASSFLMPRFFEGDIYVWPQKLSGFDVLTPLSPNAGNYTQDMYLIINAGLAVAASLYLVKIGANLNRLFNTYLCTGLIVVAISLWQFAANTVHVWFPTSFFLSNPGWALLSDETIGSVIRLSGPFSEPAALAGYLCSTVGASAWMIVNGDRRRLTRLVLVLSLGVLLLCTSTTGYAALAIMAAGLALYAFVVGSATLKKRVLMGLAGGGLVVAITVAAVPAVAPGVAHQAVSVVNATLTKQQSSSYQDRTSTDLDSLQEAAESYGLGVGWGSNRSSSLIPGLAAGIGIWGIAGLLWFVARILAHVRAAQLRARIPELKMVIHGCAGALIGILVSATLSGPGITSPDFYLLVALLIAAAGRLRWEARVAQAPLPRFAAFAAPKTLGAERIGNV